MYYEEQFINGVLMWRNKPNGEWKPCSAETLNTRLLEAGMEIECEEKRFCELTDTFDTVCKERDELQANFEDMKARNAVLKQRPDLGITRIPIYEAIKSENQELRANCARCVEALNEIIKPRTLDGWARFNCTDFVESVIDSLTQQAKLDAEVLRCAHQFYKDYDEEDLHLLSVAGKELWHAVHDTKGVAT